MAAISYRRPWSSSPPYYRARYYDPVTGRYLNEDPLAVQGDGPNFYSYALNAPTNLTDSFGQNTGAGAIPWDPPIVLPYPIRIPFPWARVVGGVIGGILGELAFPDATARDEDVLKNLPITKTDACPKNPGKPNDPCKGLRDILNEHIKRLNDYASNPWDHDNENLLGQGKDEQVIAGRVKKLLRQIKNFRKLLAECEARNGQK